MVVLITCKNEEDQSKIEELEWSQDFPHYNPMGAKPEFWSDLDQNLMQSFHNHNDAPDEIDFNWPAGRRDIHVWKCGWTDERTHRHTEAGSSPIL